MARAFAVIVLGGLAIALIVGFTNDWFGIGEPPRRAVVRIVSFDQPSNRNRVGTQPFAQGEIANDGNTTAKNCVVHWQPGMTRRSAAGGGASLVEVKAEVVEVLPARTIGFFIAPTSRFTEAGSITSSVWVTCANTESSAKVVKSAYVAA